MTDEERGLELQGETRYKQTPCGRMYVTINSKDGKVREMFAKLGKGGTCPRSFTDVVSQLASLAIRRGASVKSVRDCLLGVTCSSAVEGDEETKREEVPSCCHAIGLILEEL